MTAEAFLPDLRLCLVMNKLRPAAAAALATVLLGACSSLNPDIRAVKDTVIEENHSFFTVGRVLDFYPDCLDTSWDAYKDPRGHRWVFYSCRSKSIREFREQALADLKKEGANSSHHDRVEKALSFSEAQLVLSFRLLGESDKWKVSAAHVNLGWPDGRTASLPVPVYVVIAAMKKGEPLKPEEINEEPGFATRLFGRVTRRIELYFLLRAYENASVKPQGKPL